MLNRRIYRQSKSQRFRRRLCVEWTRSSRLARARQSLREHNSRRTRCSRPCGRFEIRNQQGIYRPSLVRLRVTPSRNRPPPIPSRRSHRPMLILNPILRRKSLDFSTEPPSLNPPSLLEPARRRVRSSPNRIDAPATLDPLPTDRVEPLPTPRHRINCRARPSSSPPSNLARLASLD